MGSLSIKISRSRLKIAILSYKTEIKISNFWNVDLDQMATNDLNVSMRAFFVNL